jgi:hypothetical protein
MVGSQRDVTGAVTCVDPADDTREALVSVCSLLS